MEILKVLLQNMGIDGFGEVRIQKIKYYQLINKENERVASHGIDGMESDSSIIEHYLYSNGKSEAFFDDYKIVREQAYLVRQSVEGRRFGPQYRENKDGGSKLLAKNGPGNCHDQKIYFDLDEILNKKGIVASETIKINNSGLASYQY